MPFLQVSKYILKTIKLKILETAEIKATIQEIIITMKMVGIVMRKKCFLLPMTKRKIFTDIILFLMVR